jgi:hypothetical protein
MHWIIALVLWIYLGARIVDAFREKRRKRKGDA